MNILHSMFFNAFLVANELFQTDDKIGLHKLIKSDGVVDARDTFPADRLPCRPLQSFL